MNSPSGVNDSSPFTQRPIRISASVGHERACTLQRLVETLGSMVEKMARLLGGFICELGSARVTADEEAAFLFPKVDDAVRVSNRRQGLRNGTERFRHEVLVLDRHAGNIHSGHAGQRASLHSGGIDHDFGRNSAAIGVDRDDVPTLDLYSGNRRVSCDLDAQIASAV